MVKKPDQTLLIVDDDILTIELVENIMGSDFSVLFALNGEQGLEIAVAERPDVILMDVMMPGMDGFEVCSRLKSDPRTRHIPLIFATVSGRAEDEIRGLELGADDFVAKPIRPHVLEIRIKHVLRRVRAEDALRETFDQSRQSVRRFAVMFEAARMILQIEDFPKTARHIFDSAAQMLDATAGYVALLSSDGQENEFLFLEAGGRPCSVSPELPMPIRCLRAESYKRNAVVLENDFMASPWMDFMPRGHVRLDNVLPGYGTGPGTASVRREHPGQRRGPAGPAQRHPGLLQNRGWPPGPGTAGFRPAPPVGRLRREHGGPGA